MIFFVHGFVGLRKLGVHEIFDVWSWIWACKVFWWHNFLRTLLLEILSAFLLSYHTTIVVTSDLYFILIKIENGYGYTGIKSMYVKQALVCGYSMAAEFASALFQLSK